MTAEITAHFFDYGGQVLRSFAIGAEPPPLYRALHDAADAAFKRITAVRKEGTTPTQMIEASKVIEDSGFTIIDDIVHACVLKIRFSLDAENRRGKFAT